ncbi:MAG: glycosyltransferase family 9 protein [SAR324 cluster bacterium]|nr:glycosyltransferase family 9 protein [SAR324 cluster bacterium]MBL7034687.1 glycosyltransferase family 9 protein [SAR324 cluster bacterium]
MFNPRKILIIRFSALGDLVLTTPVFREIKRVYPDADVTLLTSSGFGSVLDNNPHIDNFIMHNRNESFSELNSLIKQLRKEKYDLIYDAHRSLRSIWVALNLSGFSLFQTPKVWSINKRSWRRALLLSFKLNLLRNTVPQRVHLLEPLQQNTTLELQNQTELFPDQRVVTQIQNYLKKNKLQSKKFVAVSPSASYGLKCWPLDYFEILISNVLEQGLSIVLVGGPDESETSQLEENFAGKIINAAAKFSPLESAELLRHARIVVTNDSAVSHLAEAMRTPAVVLFGATVKEFGYAPFLEGSKMLETKERLRCRPCSKDGRGHCRNPDVLRCLKAISPERVFTTLAEK